MSDHILNVKKHDKVAQQAAQAGAIFMKSDSVKASVAGAEGNCEQGCEKGQCTHFATKLDKDTAENMSAIDMAHQVKLHDKVAMQAAAAGALGVKGGKPGYIHTAIDKTEGRPTGFSKTLHDTAGTISEKAAAAKDTILDAASQAKVALVGAGETAKEKVAEALPSGTGTTTTTTGHQPLLQRGWEVATDIAHKSMPILQKAASITGAIAVQAAHLAQPLIHHTANAVAAVTAEEQPKPLMDSVKERVMEAKDVLGSQLSDLKETAATVAPPSSSSTGGTFFAKEATAAPTPEMATIDMVAVKKHDKMSQEAAIAGSHLMKGESVKEAVGGGGHLGAAAPTFNSNDLAAGTAGTATFQVNVSVKPVAANPVPSNQQFNAQKRSF